VNSGSIATGFCVQKQQRAEGVQVKREATTTTMSTAPAAAKRIPQRII
jgi:hypothetical protein